MQFTKLILAIFTIAALFAIDSVAGELRAKRGYGFGGMGGGMGMGGMGMGGMGGGFGGGQSMGMGGYYGK
ncbi:hypothetical protein WR25_26869 isoform A [Diploscapter pachys]|uniref:Uncharacterized protein n=1 Tax=Diploscapter pachys TaxID=2018661 RepID=A0A2A2L6Z8_9BILA|nr:hypothetical protein WR25_26869 isoform A [Diploscapter pachys]